MVYGWRVFVRRILDAICTLRSANHKCVLTLEMQRDSHINFKELAPVVLAAQKWGPLWANKPVIVLSDNSTTEACVNRGSSRSVLLMKYLRHIFWLSVVFNFRLKAVHVLGEDNVLADIIYGLHEPEARQYLTILLVLSPLSWHMSYNGFLYILDRSSVSGLAR